MDKVDRVGHYGIYWDRALKCYLVYLEGTDALMLKSHSSSECYDYCRSCMRIINGLGK